MSIDTESVDPVSVDPVSVDPVSVDPVSVDTGVVLRRPMASAALPVWSGALWVGELDLRVLDHAVADGLEALHLLDAEGHQTARLLVRDAGAVLGFVEVPILVDAVPVAALVDATSGFVRTVDPTGAPVDAAPHADAVDGDAVGADAVGVDDVGADDVGAEDVAQVDADPTEGLTTVTVVICTRDRADQLRDALTSVLAIDHAAFDVVVVDNASATAATADLLAAEFPDPRVRLVREPVPGLGSARNTGLRHATGTVVAFTDDDVVVDPGWLTAITRAFASAPDVALVSGLVPSGELRTPVQRYFDDRVSWSKNLNSRTFRLADQPADLPMFPFSVGEFGTGANFAVLRRTALDLGGFDTAFGVGTRTGGGEDLDVFTRVLFAGHALVVEPSAIVWHRHRSDLAALRTQARGYGIGLGAWLTKVALEPRMVGRAARRAPQAFARLVGNGAAHRTEGPEHAVGGTHLTMPPTVGSGSASHSVADTLMAIPTHDELAREVRMVARLELVSVLLGPGRFLRQRWEGATVLDDASRSAVTDEGAPAHAATKPFRRPTVWGLVAGLAALVGLSALLPGVPEWWRGIAVGALVLVGPGAALRSHLDMRPSTAMVLVPATGITVTVLISAGMAATGVWGVDGALVAIALLTAAGGLDRWMQAGWRPERRTTAHRADRPWYERRSSARTAAARERGAAVRRPARSEEGVSS